MPRHHRYIEEPDLEAAVALAELLRNWRLGFFRKDAERNLTEMELAAFIVRTLKGDTR